MTQTRIMLKKPKNLNMVTISSYQLWQGEMVRGFVAFC